MFLRHNFETLPYSIAPNDVHLYENQLQMNINVFSFFDAKVALAIPWKSVVRTTTVANLFYWKEHYAPITSIPRLFSDITKHGHEHQICFRCLGHFHTEESFACHKELCTRDDFMSMIHVLPAPGSK